MEGQKKKFKFDSHLEMNVEPPDPKTFKDDPTKSTGLLGKIGKDLVAFIGQNMIYHHTWVNFIQTCPLAYRACMEPSIDTRPRWSIMYNPERGRQVHWKFEATQGHYDPRCQCIFVKVIHPEAIHVSRFGAQDMARDDSVILPMDPMKDLAVYKMGDANFKLISAREDSINKPHTGEWAEIYIPNTLRFHMGIPDQFPEAQNEQGRFLFGIFPEKAMDYDDQLNIQEDLDAIFNIGRIRKSAAVFLPSEKEVKQIEEELKYFIYHLGIILDYPIGPQIGRLGVLI